MICPSTKFWWADDIIQKYAAEISQDIGTRWMYHFSMLNETEIVFEKHFINHQVNGNEVSGNDVSVLY